MLIESSAIYAVWSLVFIIVYVVDISDAILLLTTLNNVQARYYPLQCIGMDELEVLTL